MKHILSRFFLGITVAMLMVGFMPHGVYAQTAQLAQAAAEPTVALSYNKKTGYFLLVTSNLQSVSYTIEYSRAVGGGREALEGLSGAGKGKKTAKGVMAYARSLYAGTQSSRYKVPHTVKKGKLILKGKKTNGGDYTYTKNFVVTNGRLSFTK